MIVMKFGGSSLGTPAAVRRVSNIVRDRLPEHPVVVVSAIGDTTDSLVSLLDCARRGESYLVARACQQLSSWHRCFAEDLLTAEAFEPVAEYIDREFLALEADMLRLSRGETVFSAQLQDRTLAVGEQVSSRIVAAAFACQQMAATYFDSRKLVVTDDSFTCARPLVWETYARIRWTLEHAARTAVPVVAGFVGSTEDGRTTTLGRGGSDLTASLIGAALNASQIQFWKDVDGILSWDPRLKDGALRVRHLSYGEAAELAGAGACVLHPETIAPAQRLRIPLVVRNTFDPSGEGTLVDARGAGGGALVKCVVCCSSSSSRGGSAEVTLVGDEIARPAMLRKVTECLGAGDTIAPSTGTRSIRIALADPFSLLRCLERLRRTFFEETDEAIFASCARTVNSREKERTARVPVLALA